MRRRGPWHCGDRLHARSLRFGRGLQLDHLRGLLLVELEVNRLPKLLSGQELEGDDSEGVHYEQRDIMWRRKIAAVDVGGFVPQRRASDLRALAHAMGQRPLGRRENARAHRTPMKKVSRCGRATGRV